MRRIIIVKNIDQATLKIIQSSILGVDNDKIYLVLGNPEIHNLRSLNALGFTEQGLPEHSRQYSDEFLREYIDLIGSISKENNSLEWWATDIASKNRFTSKITELLSEFLNIVKIVRSKQFKIMVVINPNWAIVSSLKKAFLNDHVELVMGSDFEREKLRSLMTSRLKILASTVSDFGRIIIKSIYCHFMLGRKIRRYINDAAPYYVIKTFIYNSSFTKEHNYNDTFFGKLPGILIKNRKVLSLAYIFGNFRYCLRAINKCDEFKIIPIEFFANFLDLILACQRLILSRIIVGDKYMFGCEVAGIIRNELDRTWNGIQYYQLLHYWILKRLLSKIKVDTFLLTYENNPWEKMCIAALRQTSPDTYIIGYQHTIVCQASANMFPSHYENDIMPLPDKILTVGEANKNIMQRYGYFGDTLIRASCGLRFEYLFDVERLKRKSNGNILVALEGVRDTNKLAAYVIKEIGGDSKYEVRIRTHPILPWQYFQKKYRFDLAKYSNFNLSTGRSVRADLEWADTVIYWGSTIGIEALNIGRPIVHYSTNFILNYDPLFESSELKWVVNDNVTLTTTLEKINSLDNNEFDYLWNKAKIYLNKYFHPITEENLKEFIKDKA